MVSKREFVKRFFNEKISSKRFLSFLLVSLILINIVLALQWNHLGSRVDGKQSKFETIQPYYGDVEITDYLERHNNFSVYSDGLKVLLIGTLNVSKGLLPVRMYFDSEKSLLFNSQPYPMALTFPPKHEILGFLPLQQLNSSNSRNFGENGNNFYYVVIGPNGESSVKLTLYPWQPSSDFFKLPEETKLFDYRTCVSPT